MNILTQTTIYLWVALQVKSLELLEKIKNDLSIRKYPNGTRTSRDRKQNPFEPLESPKSLFYRGVFARLVLPRYQVFFVKSKSSIKMRLSTFMHVDRFYDEIFARGGA